MLNFRFTFSNGIRVTVQFSTVEDAKTAVKLAHAIGQAIVDLEVWNRAWLSIL